MNGWPINNVRGWGVFSLDIDWFAKALYTKGKQKATRTLN